MDKIYFYDTGVRNAVVGNLNMFHSRDDVGKLWENFLITERVKKQSYAQQLCSHYFWRLSSGAELDLVEESEGNMRGFEFKYGKKLAKPPKSWITTYPHATVSVINQNNWQKFVL